jgi:N-acetylglucosaminyldiphosphoundecaprenol N-acetyl-beta-D-mannosaminyltransferase
MKKEKYLGVDVCIGNMKDTLEEISTIIDEKKPSFVVAINPEKLMKARADEKLKNLLNSARIQIPDGIGIIYASRLNGGSIGNRVTGIDLMINICSLASERGYRIFLLGAKPMVAQRAAEILREKYKNINIVGVMDGYFKNDEEVIERVNELKPDILFAALGSPKQEYWITKNMDILSVPLCMGVGGSFDVICGNIKRAPKWMCKLGLEWLYRLIKEPWRFKRMLVLPAFLLKVIAERVKK